MNAQLEAGLARIRALEGELADAKRQIATDQMARQFTYGNGVPQWVVDALAERQRQVQKWGEQNHDDIKEGFSYTLTDAETAKETCERRFSVGSGTWTDIFIEEVSEAIDEAGVDEDRLVVELVQCIAVAGSWIEAIKRRQAARGGEK